jgi:uncharacterized membrane protein YkvA (DUF1232 family)
MSTLLTILIALAITYAAILIALLVLKPDDVGIAAAMRVLPDTLALVSRLARDRSLPLSTRAPVWALAGYLAFPIDLVPDFLPVIGYADDAIVLSIVLRHVIRRAGPDAIHRHWRGPDDGLRALSRLTGTQLHDH